MPFKSPPFLMSLISIPFYLYVAYGLDLLLGVHTFFKCCYGLLLIKFCHFLFPTFHSFFFYSLHSPPINVGFFCLQRLPIILPRSGEIKGIWLVTTWLTPICISRDTKSLDHCHKFQILGPMFTKLMFSQTLLDYLFSNFQYSIFCPVKDESILMSFFSQM